MSRLTQPVRRKLGVKTRIGGQCPAPEKEREREKFLPHSLRV